jgi:hypothetical protein
MGKIEEMEKMLKEAHAEKSRLMESRVRQTWALGLPSARRGPPPLLRPLPHIVLAAVPEEESVFQAWVPKVGDQEAWRDDKFHSP